MAQIIITIPDDKVDSVRDAMWGLYPVDKDPETMEPRYTKNQWAKQVIVNQLKRDVFRWKQVGAATTAKNAIQYDDTIAT